MANSNFRISHDYTRRLIEIELSGFWNDEDYSQYLAELQTHLRGYELRRESYSVLCDLSLLDVQQAAIVSRFGELLMAAGPVDARIALVAPSALLRLQVQRLIDRPSRAVFAEKIEASHWLFGGDQQHD